MPLTALLDRKPQRPFPDECGHDELLAALGRTVLARATRWDHCELPNDGMPSNAICTSELPQHPDDLSVGLISINSGPQHLLQRESRQQAGDRFSLFYVDRRSQLGGFAGCSVLSGQS
jgi:hypothetical protein